MTKVHRDSDRVWLEGVCGWSWRDKRSSIQAAQAAVVHACGEAVSYEYLVGVSGLAFRMQLSKEGFCPSSPHAFCGFQCVARSTQALPWNVRVYSGKPEQTEHVREIRQAILASIDRGVPVQYGSEEDGIIVGHRKGGEEWLCLHPMREAGTKMFVETTLGWGIAVFTARKAELPDRRALAEAALEQAVEMAGTREAGGYLAGFEAWEQYIARLGSLEDADDRAKREALLGNGWIFACLAQHRACAASCLREISGEFAGPAAESLEKAADLYERIATQVLTDQRQAFSGWDQWRGELRQEQIQRLQNALPLERQAIAEIEQAITLAAERRAAAPGSPGAEAAVKTDEKHRSGS